MSLGTPNFFSSHFNLVISFAWEKTDLISIILQFGSHGKQFGSNILTRIELSVKIKLKSLFVSDTSIECSSRRVFMSLGSQRVYNNLECFLVISIK